MSIFITIIVAFLIMNFTFASPMDKAVLASAYSQGVTIYHTCIVPPPSDPTTAAYCTTIYTTYVVTLGVLNAPFPLIISLDPSPYVWSPYDICRYEVAHMVFNSPATTPYYCPTI